MKNWIWVVVVSGAAVASILVSKGQRPDAPGAQEGAELGVVLYTKERLEELGLYQEEAASSFIRTYADSATDPPKEFVGELQVKPLVFGGVSAGCREADINNTYRPAMVVLDFNVPSTNPNPLVKCVFDLVVGRTGEGSGQLGKSEKTIDKLIQAGEPMYWIKEGWAILGGQLGVVRGRRSRAAAPGTQCAILLHGKETDSEFYDVYVLLNATGSHRVNVYADKEVPMTNRNVACVVKKNGEAVEVDLTGATAPPEPLTPAMVASFRTFRDQATVIACAANLRGK